MFTLLCEVFKGSLQYQKLSIFADDQQRVFIKLYIFYKKKWNIPFFIKSYKEFIKTRC